MKRPRAKPPPHLVPRSNSLLYQLQHCSTADEDPSCLDQLMIFLDDPPPGVRDRWMQGSRMCATWGISCSGASVWRLYRSYVLDWRLGLAHEASADASRPNDSFDEKTTRMVERRTFEVLANPQSPPACLVSLARIEVRKNTLKLRRQTLNLARQKYRDNQLTKLDRAFEALAIEVGKNPAALVAFNQLCAIFQALEDGNEPPTSPSPS